MAKGATVRMKKRLNRHIMIVAVVLVLALVGNLFRISALQSDFYTDYANNQQLRSETIPASRGTIYDRNMEILAQSSTVWDVSISPKDIASGIKDEQKLKEKQELIAKTLSSILDTDEAALMEKIKKTNSQYQLVGKKVSKETADQIRAFAVEQRYTSEIHLAENTKRYYPNNQLAASLIGFTGSDSQGLYGLESKYDDVLKGTPGYTVSLKNAQSEDMPQNFEQRYDPVDGQSLRLTLDENIQSFVETTLYDVVKQHNPKNGACAIVMDCNTGAILAMANYPTFNLNDPFTIQDEQLAAAVEEITDEEAKKEAKSAAQQKQWSNMCISHTYQPGSTFKTVVGASAIEEKVAFTNSTYSCSGYVVIGGERMRCNNRSGHGTLDFTSAMVHSCNPAFINIGLSLGPERFFEYYKAFGFTEKTGIDLPGEQVGTYYGSNMSDVSLASSSFGQSQTVTPLQLITAVCAVTNGGYLVQPYVVQDFLDSNNNVISSHEPTIKRQVISEETSATLRSVMEEVVNANGGTNGSVKGYRIAAKSGTSQRLNPGDEANTYIASYVAVAPADDPQIAVMVMADYPQNGAIYGGTIAAPAVAAIMANTLPYLGYSPEYSEEELASMETTVPLLYGKDIAAAKNKLIASGITGGVVVKGDGDKVVRQMPSSGEKIPKDGKVILYTDDSEQQMVAVPDVRQLSAAEAKQRLKQLNLNVTVTGGVSMTSAGKVQQQSVSPGTSVPVGTVVELTVIGETLD